MKEWGETRVVTVDALTTNKKRIACVKADSNSMQLLRYHSLHKSQATIGLVSVVTLIIFLYKHSSWF